MYSIQIKMQIFAELTLPDSKANPKTSVRTFKLQV